MVETRAKFGEGGSRVHRVNLNFIDHISHETAWFLGFTVGDGCIYRTRGRNNKYSVKGVTFGVNPRDTDVLEKIKEIAGYSGPIRLYVGKKYALVHLRIYSATIGKKLNAMGIACKKSQKETFLSCITSKDHIRGFILGLLDSDGMVRHYKNVRDTRTEIRFTGTKQLLACVNRRLPCNIVGTLRRDARMHNQYSLSICARRALKLLTWLYNPLPKYYMNRKYQKYIEIKKYYEEKDRKNA